MAVIKNTGKAAGVRPLKSLEEWGQFAGPKRASHWKEGRSAMEVARAWLSVSSPELPPEVAATLTSHVDFGPVLSWSAEPEVQLRFDRLRGEPRNTDLLVKARDTFGDFVIAVEAKADEAFGQTVAHAAAAARVRLLKNPRSRGLERIAELLRTLLGATLEEEPSLGGLRYQLLTATAGALAASRANGRCRVVLLVQEFRTMATNDRRHSRNGEELNAFSKRLSEARVPHIEAGQLYGPLEFDDLIQSGPLYIGKAMHDLRSPVGSPVP